MSTTIEDRFILLLKENADAGGHGFWKRLGETTNISTQRWHKAFMRRQRPTLDMIETLARLFPRYAFWLVTGVTDETNGHSAPVCALTFPERLYSESIWTDQYLRASLALQEKLYEEGKVNLADDQERLSATERKKLLAHWVAGNLVDTAYELSKTDDYAQLKLLWSEREKERAANLARITGEYRPWVEKGMTAIEKGVKLDPMFGVDPRSIHQDSWDLFYIPPPENKKHNE